MQSPSAQEQADKVQLLESFDSCADIRNRLRVLATRINEYAGIPLPIEGERLVVAPSYVYAEVFNRQEGAGESADSTINIRNVFWSCHTRADVYVYEQDGRVKCVKDYNGTQLNKQLHTLGCSAAWGIEQEAKALQLLGTLIKHHQMKQYLLTGSFLESSSRSHLTYMFRKLRPTVVIDAKDKDATACRVLCALCLHTIGYYEGSWAGALCPTDDVIAHLMLMRGDEHLLWKRSTQHPPWRSEAGL